jgi:glycosyltransferase involved in cell wall biosynthesis
MQPPGHRLRIALVTPMLPVEHDPTRGRYIHETARSLSRLADVKVFFQTLRYPRIGVAPTSYLYGHVDASYRLEGIDVEAFSYRGLPLVSRGLNGWLAARALTPRVRRFRPDVMLAYWVYPDGAAALRAARQLELPCVVGALGSDIHVRSGLNALLTRRTIRGADALIAVSEAMRQSAIRDFGAQPACVQTIVNGYNTSVFAPMEPAPLRKALGLPAAAQVLVYVGRFVESKGLVELVAAFSRLAAQRPQLHLALVGDGVMKQRLVSLVQASGARDRVLMPGGMAPHDVARWINASDLLVLPSWSEGCPNVVVEALACGRPVVATDVGGTREIVNAHNGLLVAPRDVEALCAAIDRALARHWDHAAIAARMRRSWDDVARETLDVCRRLVVP